MKQKLILGSVAVMAGVLVLGFQNCGKKETVDSLNSPSNVSTTTTLRSTEKITLQEVQFTGSVPESSGKYFLGTAADLGALDQNSIAYVRKGSLKIYKYQVAGTQGLYRLYNELTHSHFYTHRQYYDLLLTYPASGWRGNDLQGYVVFPVGGGDCPSNTVKVYGLFSGEKTPVHLASHRFTTSLTIASQLEALGWVEKNNHIFCAAEGSTID